MRIAHLSDLHLLSLEGAIPFRLLNKRLTGYANLRFRRKAVHKPAPVTAAARAIRKLGVDHVVITGDLSNLALEVEFDRVKTFLADDLQLPPAAVSLVPGNHDAYTHGAHRSRRFQQFFGEFLTSDLPLERAPHDLSAFPYVRLRGPVALIGLSSAVPSLPLVAAGALGRPQLTQLEALLAHPEVRERYPVLLLHHPIHNPTSALEATLKGLRDADELARSLRGLERGLLLHGHLHRRIWRRLPTERGHVDAIGTTSASLLDTREDRHAGFNVYEWAGPTEQPQVRSFAFRAEDESFFEVPIPRG